MSLEVTLNVVVIVVALLAFAVQYIFGIITKEKAIIVERTRAVQAEQTLEQVKQQFQQLSQEYQRILNVNSEMLEGAKDTSHAPARKPGPKKVK